MLPSFRSLITIRYENRQLGVWRFTRVLSAEPTRTIHITEFGTVTRPHWKNDHVTKPLNEASSSQPALVEVVHCNYPVWPEPEPGSVGCVCCGHPGWSTVGWSSNVPLCFSVCTNKQLPPSTFKHLALLCSLPGTRTSLLWGNRPWGSTSPTSMSGWTP